MNPIQDRIAKLKSEQFELQKAHDQMVAQFQSQVAANQARFHQINGAIAELSRLLSEEQPMKVISNEQHPTPRSGHAKHRAVTD